MGTQSLDYVEKVCECTLESGQLIQSPHEPDFSSILLTPMIIKTHPTGWTRSPDPEGIWSDWNRRGEGNPRRLCVKGFRPTQREERFWKQLTKLVWILGFMEESPFFQPALSFSRIQEVKSCPNIPTPVRDCGVMQGEILLAWLECIHIVAPIYTSYLWHKSCSTKRMFLRKKNAFFERKVIMAVVSLVNLQPTRHRVWFTNGGELEECGPQGLNVPAHSHGRMISTGRYHLEQKSVNNHPKMDCQYFRPDIFNLTIGQIAIFIIGFIT